MRRPRPPAPTRVRRRGAARLWPALLLGALLTPTSLRGQAVLNTQRVEPQDVSGFFTRIEAGTDLQGGNSHVTNLKGDAALGYRAAHWWLEVVGGAAYLNSSDSLSTDDRFAQVRYGWFLSQRTRTFHFVQVQRSHELALSYRLLFGSGVRHDFVWSARDRLDLGAGLMWEIERLDPRLLPRGTRLHYHDLRADLVAVGSRKLSSTTKLSDVLYVEPRVDAPADTRLLEDLTLAVSVAKDVDLNVEGQWLHDSQPPRSIKRDDVELQTSFSVTVK